MAGRPYCLFTFESPRGKAGWAARHHLQGAAAPPEGREEVEPRAAAPGSAVPPGAEERAVRKRDRPPPRAGSASPPHSCSAAPTLPVSQLLTILRGLRVCTRARYQVCQTSRGSRNGNWERSSTRLRSKRLPAQQAACLVCVAAPCQHAAGGPQAPKLLRNAFLKLFIHSGPLSPLCPQMGVYLKTHVDT